MAMKSQNPFTPQGAHGATSMGNPLEVRGLKEENAMKSGRTMSS